MFIYNFPKKITIVDLKELFNKIKDNLKYYKIVWQKKEKVDIINNIDNINDYDYILITYNIYPRNLIDVIEKELRWIIFKKTKQWWQILSRPLHKFYNAGEEILINNVADISTNLDFYVDKKSDLEIKEDGTMLQIFLDKKNSDLLNKITYDKHSLIVNTKWTLKENKYLKDWIKNNKKHLDQLYLMLLELQEKYNEPATIIVEYINPDLEIHVVPYESFVVYLLDIRLNYSWKYLSRKEIETFYNKYLSNLENFEITWHDVLDDKNSLYKYKNYKYFEWFVIKHKDPTFTNFVKFKTDWYINKVIRSDLEIQSLTLQWLFVLYLLNEIDTFLQKIENTELKKFFESIGIDKDEYKDFINKMINKINEQFMSFIEKKYNLLKQEKIDLIDVFKKQNKYDKIFIYLVKNYKKENLTDLDIINFQKIVINYFLDSLLANIYKNKIIIDKLIEFKKISSVDEIFSVPIQETEYNIIYMLIEKFHRYLNNISNNLFRKEKMIFLFNLIYDYIEKESGLNNKEIELFFKLLDPVKYLIKPKYKFIINIFQVISKIKRQIKSWWIINNKINKKINDYLLKTYDIKNPLLTNIYRKYKKDFINIFDVQEFLNII